jgi:hypothetical protein
VKKLGFALFASVLSVSGWSAGKHASRPTAVGSEQQAAPSPVISVMSQELDREMPVLSKANPPAYFLSYILTSTDRSEVMGSNGALLASEESDARRLETQQTEARAGLDNTHKVENPSRARKLRRFRAGR